jgi:hypothetical protein
MKLRLLRFLVLVFVTSCSALEGPSENLNSQECQLGIQLLRTAHQDWTPLSEAVALIYSNERGEEITFTPRYKVEGGYSAHQLDGVGCNGPEQFAFWDLEQYQYRFEGPDQLVIFVGLDVTFAPIDNFSYEAFREADFYDRLIVAVSKEGESDAQNTFSHSLRLVTSDRDNPMINNQKANLEQFVFNDELEINGITYSSVYHPPGNDPGFFYTPQQGVIGFYDADQVFWQLSRVVE